MVRELHSSHTNPDEKAKFKETTNNIFFTYPPQKSMNNFTSPRELKAYQLLLPFRLLPEACDVLIPRSRSGCFGRRE